MRTYPGRAPKNGRLAYHLLAFPGPDGAAEDWDLYVLPGNTRDAVWLSAKLVARTEGLPKGNYFLGWNVRDKRMYSRSGCAKVLATHRPLLHDAVSYLLDLFAECFGIPLGGDALSALDLRVTDFGPDRDYAALCRTLGWEPLIGAAPGHPGQGPNASCSELPLGALCAPMLCNRDTGPRASAAGSVENHIGDPDEDLL